MKPSHRNTLRRVRFVSLLLAGWTFRPTPTEWEAYDPQGNLAGWARTREGVIALAENFMVREGLLKKRYFQRPPPDPLIASSTEWKLPRR